MLTLSAGLPVPVAPNAGLIRHHVPPPVLRLCVCNMVGSQSCARPMGHHLMECEWGGVHVRTTNRFPCLSSLPHTYPPHLINPLNSIGAPPYSICIVLTLELLSCMASAPCCLLAPP